MKTLFIATVLCMCTLLSSCAFPPKATVICIRDLEVTPPSERIIVVSDLGPRFQAAFEKYAVDITPPRCKSLETMSYMEFIRSPYNKPDMNDSFSNRLFVFITKRSVSSNGYVVMSAEYLLEVKYLNKEPFLVQKIHLDGGSSYSYTDRHEKRAAELARTIFEELKARKIL